MNWVIFTLIKSSEVADMKSSFVFRKRVFLLPASTDYTSHFHAIVESSRYGEYGETNALYIADCCRKIELDFVLANKHQERLALRRINLIIRILFDSLAKEIALIEKAK